MRAILVLFLFFLLCLVGCGGAGNASARCVDGSLSYSQNCSGTCSSHGGVAQWFNGCGGNGNSAGDNPPAPPRSVQ